jgi:hypothetical protein
MQHGTTSKQAEITMKYVVINTAKQQQLAMAAITHASTRQLRHIVPKRVKCNGLRAGGQHPHVLNNVCVLAVKSILSSFRNIGSNEVGRHYITSCES